MNTHLKNYSIFFLLSLYFIASFVIVYLFNGTGERGSGDSIMHYLHSKHASTNPELFLDHWAKPIFVFLSFPFASFGFNGIKLFNILITSFTLFYTYKTAIQLNYKNAILASIILLCIPLYFVLTFSGLTEPLFALFTIYSTYLFARKKYIMGSIIISFLPFIRSEGLIIIGVFGFLLLLKKQWKSIPYLSTGHVLYSIIGYFYYKDIFWVFTKIPYAKLSSTYNSGELLHFVHQLFYVIGIPIYILFSIGILFIFYQLIRNKKVLFSETSILILGGFLAYFIAHSLFWYLGIFNSMGLKRVLIGIAPFIALISLQGFNLLTENQWLKKILLKKSIQYILTILIIIFPFTSNKSAINWEKDFSLVQSQLLAKEIIPFVKKNKILNNTYVFSDPYLAEILDINYFNKAIRLPLSKSNLKQIKEDDLIIWDSWFSVIENGISEQEIRSIDSLKEIKTFRTNSNGREISYILFSKK